MEDDRSIFETRRNRKKRDKGNNTLEILRGELFRKETSVDILSSLSLPGFSTLVTRPIPANTFRDARKNQRIPRGGIFR